MIKNNNTIKQHNQSYCYDRVIPSELAIITICICIKFIFSALLLNEGFIALSADDFARQLSGYAWSQEPYLFKSQWPPLQFWILGFFLKTYPNIKIVNLIINGIFSALGLIYLNFLVRLFFGRIIALITLAIAVVLPLQLKLSLSGLCEPIYHFVFLAGLFYLFKWESTGRKSEALICAICILCGTMLRIEAWTYYISVCLYLIFMHILIKPSLLKETLKEQKSILLIIFLPFIFILLWTFLGKAQANFTSFRESFISSSSMLSSIPMRLLRYPGYLFLSSPLIATAGIVGIIPLLQHDYKLALKYLSIPAFYFLGLVGISVLSGADPTAAPLRLVVPFIYLLIPIALMLFLRSPHHTVKKMGYAFIACILAWNIFFSFNFNRNDFFHIAQVSKILSNAWSTDVLKDKQKIIFEKNSLTPYKYDHLALKVLSNHPDNIALHEKSDGAFLLEDAINQSGNGTIGAFIVSSRDLKEHIAKHYQDVVTVGPYNIFFVSNNINTTTTTEIADLKQPKYTTAVDFGQTATLVGYTVNNDLFPLGCNTFWKIRADLPVPLIIEYKLLPKTPTAKPLILTPHNLGYIKNKKNYSPGSIIVDWQELALSERGTSGEYTVLVRIKDPDGNSNESISISDQFPWTPLKKVTLIKSKRDVLNQMMAGELSDIMIGLKVFIALF